MNEYRYELRVVSDYDYNGFADVGFFYFTNGVSSAFGPAGHSEKKFRGKTVLCRLQSGTAADGKSGFYFVGLAEVTKFSSNGRPVEFGDYVGNHNLGGWEPPAADEKIYDGRKELSDKAYIEGVR